MQILLELVDFVLHHHYLTLSTFIIKHSGIFLPLKVLNLESLLAQLILIPFDFAAIFCSLGVEFLNLISQRTSVFLDFDFNDFNGLCESLNFLLCFLVLGLHVQEFTFELSGEVFALSGR